MDSNKNLIEWYWKGWKSEKTGKTETEGISDLQRKAFIMGIFDFIAGDDIPSIDLKTEEEIIRQIRNK